jgi:hypothetical protein
MKMRYEKCPFCAEVIKKTQPLNVNIVAVIYAESPPVDKSKNTLKKPGKGLETIKIKPLRLFFLSLEKSGNIT